MCTVVFLNNGEGREHLKIGSLHIKKSRSDFWTEGNTWKHRACVPCDSNGRVSVLAGVLNISPCVSGSLVTICHPVHSNVYATPDLLPGFPLPGELGSMGVFDRVL